MSNGIRIGTFESRFFPAARVSGMENDILLNGTHTFLLLDQEIGSLVDAHIIFMLDSSGYTSATLPLLFSFILLLRARA